VVVKGGGVTTPAPTPFCSMFLDKYLKTTRTFYPLPYDIFFMAGSIFDNSISVRQIKKQHNVEPVLKNHSGLLKL
jgi:hypothetical protein